MLSQLPQSPPCVPEPPVLVVLKATALVVPEVSALGAISSCSAAEVVPKTPALVVPESAL